uniref:Uncharacterized protein n=1 Tax=Chenopodium quinoa TaxID=63459 RepID=A0A803M366_CHEQI
MELLGRLRRAVKKLTFLLNLKKFLTSSTWQVASLIRARAPAITRTSHWNRRAYSFSDRPGLRACVEGSSSTSSPPTLQRATSYPLELDIDKHAQAFIDNFHRHLVYEKQVSLELRYCGHGSSSSTSDSIVSPLSSVSSQFVSPT